jgi:hypothetical protein
LPSIEPEFALDAQRDHMMHEKKYGTGQNGSHFMGNSFPMPLHQIKPPSEDSALIDDETLYAKISED